MTNTWERICTEARAAAERGDGEAVLDQIRAAYTHGNDDGRRDVGELLEPERITEIGLTVTPQQIRLEVTRAMLEHWGDDETDPFVASMLAIAGAIETGQAPPAASPPNQEPDGAADTTG